MSDDMKDNMSTEHSLLTFPCDFMIKVVGKDNSTFRAAVLAIIEEHVANFKEDALSTRSSAQNNYLALSITVQVESKQKLDQIYLALTACPDVLMAL